MTWLKLDETFDDDCANAGLSSDAYRVHVAGLLHCMRRLTDGFVDDRTASRMDVDDPREALSLLCAVGFWAKTPAGYTVVHQMEHQPTRKEVEDRKAANSARQAKARSKKSSEARAKAETELAVTRDTTRDNRRDSTRDSQDVTTDRSGTVRNGALKKELLVPVQEPAGWE